MPATVHTSVFARDLTKVAADLIINDPRFSGTRNDSLEELMEDGRFQQALGKAICGKIDWEHVRYRRAHPKHGRKSR